MDGKAAEKGTHDELMAKHTYYRKLVENQEGPQKSKTIDKNLHDHRVLVQPFPNPKTPDGCNMLPHVEFKEVKFAYPTRLKSPVLDGLNLVVPQSKSFAICGPSGGGKVCILARRNALHHNNDKVFARLCRMPHFSNAIFRFASLDQSTVFSLIERFYDPTEGSLYYMGHDVKSLNVAWLRDQIGYVGQEPTLFNDTIANNIAYGASGASRAQIENAAKQAYAHDFIIELADGYETKVGERGAQLSGGQKQRVAVRLFVCCFLLTDSITTALLCAPWAFSCFHLRPQNV